ncbi:MAG: hypothetical protein WBE31_05930 [Candidatus Sulfotelmatobacter sp.]
MRTRTEAWIGPSLPIQAAFQSCHGQFFTYEVSLPVWPLLSLDEEQAAHELWSPDGKQASHAARLQAGVLQLVEAPVARVL